jgi:hypothetical protein
MQLLRRLGDLSSDVYRVLMKHQWDYGEWAFRNDLLRMEPTPSEKASLARLLAVAQGASRELRAWCDKELLRQTRQLPAAETGLDILLKEERCVTQSLADVLVASDTDIVSEE